MAKWTQSAKVGAFFTGAVVAGYAVYSTLGGAKVGSGRGYTVHGYIKDATGLANHSRVTIAGIPVGQIEKIYLEDGKARVDVRMLGNVKLYEGATLGKKSASILGESAIVLTPGMEGSAELHDGDEVHSIIESPTTDQIMTDVARIADRIKVVSEQLAGAMGTEKGGSDMKRILANLADATEALNETVRENRISVRQTLEHVNRITGEGEPKIAAILDNVRAITSDVRVLVSPTDGKGGSGELRQTIERVNRASASLESALAHVDAVAGRIDRGEGSIGRLTKDESLVTEVEGVAEGIGDYVDGIRRLQTVVGLRSDYNFLAGTIKNYVELRLQPREDKYYVIELINDPRGRTTFTQTDVDSTNPNDPAHYRTVTTQTTDAFRVTVQFARRVNLGEGFGLTARFGIKESTGGLGLDAHLLNGRFEVVNDVFGFGEGTSPRYRLWLGYEFLKKVWFIGGVDNVLLAERRDYFMGLQLRFTDDDLKTILPFATIPK